MATNTTTAYTDNSEGNCTIHFPSVKSKTNERWYNGADPEPDFEAASIEAVKRYQIGGRWKDMQPNANVLGASQPIPNIGSINYTGGSNNGFVDAVAFAFYEHVPIAIRPDEVWAAIVYQLAHFVELHAEAMRHLFVSHDGKKQLQVKSSRWPSFEHVESDPEFVPQFVGAICDMIEKNVKTPELVAWCQTRFSTSTPTDQLVKRIGLMAALKSYFEYGFKFSCGFPRIVLEGTKADWQAMIAALDYLKSDTFKAFEELKHWANVLEYTLSHFVDAYDGAVNERFWQSPILERSGYSDYDGSHIHGWILAFAPFSKGGKSFLDVPVDQIKETYKFTTLRVHPDDISTCANTVPITFIGSDAKETRLTLYAGVFMHMDKDAQAKRDKKAKWGHKQLVAHVESTRERYSAHNAWLLVKDELQP